MNNADWWAKKLGNNPQPTPPRQVELPLPPSQQPMQVMPQFQSTATPATAASQAQSAMAAGVCPECRSTDYFGDPANPNTAKRCYSCGYPVQQSGSRYGALTGAHVEGAATAAIGNDTSGTYNPQQIIGRV